MQQDDLQKTDPCRLSVLMQPGEPASFWNPEDYAQILQHQLEAPLEFPVSGSGPAVDGDWKTDPRIRTFGELLLHPHPPVKLLELTKELAKASTDRLDGELPPDVATVLYFAAIAAAMVRGTRITTLPDAEVLAGLEWSLRREWLASSLKALFTSARSAIC